MVGTPPAAPTRAPIEKAKAAGIGAIGTAASVALLMALSLIRPSEGELHTAVRDFAKGVPTVCDGHTGPDVKLGQHATHAQCEVLLTADGTKARDAVATCVPGLRSHPAIWAASTSMAFNTGTQAFCGSSTAAAFRAGQWRAGCDAMLLWDKAVVHGVKVVVPGLLARRERERAVCLLRLS